MCSGPYNRQAHGKCCALQFGQRRPQRSDVVVPLTAPRVALGLFVYNGERYLRETLESILAQSLDEFMLYISDNGSSDGTEAICREYEAADVRVSYYRHDLNRGAAWNCNYVASLGWESEFFKWCAHDDLYDPVYLETCVATLDEHPEVVACQPRARYIDRNGEEVMRSFERHRFSDPRPWVRLQALTCAFHDYTFAFAVIRRSILDQIRPYLPIVEGDLVMLADLALRGPFAEPDDQLFANRIHPTRSTAMAQGADWRKKSVEWFGGHAQRAPARNLLSELAKGVELAPLSSVERLRCRRVLGQWSLRWFRDLVFESRFFVARDR